MAKTKFNPDYSVAPGATLKEALEDRGLSQSDLCLRTGLAEKTISQIINGVAPISYETAEKLEFATGIPATFWNHRELTYRQAIVRHSENSKLAANKDWLKEIPIKELINRGFISSTTDKGDLVRQSLNFFGVSSVESWRKTWLNPQVQFRGKKSHDKHPGFVAAWLRIGESMAQGIECEPFDASEFRKSIAKAISLTVAPAAEWPSKLRDICAPAGVAVVFVKEIPSAGVSGVAKWLTKDKAMIQVSLKFKTDDQLWFSFFHEAGHILLHSKKQVFIEYGRSSDNKEEEEANEFARNVLIPAEHVPRLRLLKRKSEIRRFASEIGVSPGIVVGRLQHEDFLPRSHCNDLKRKLIWG